MNTEQLNKFFKPSLSSLQPGAISSTRLTHSTLHFWHQPGHFIKGKIKTVRSVSLPGLIGEFGGAPSITAYELMKHPGSRANGLSTVQGALSSVGTMVFSGCSWSESQNGLTQGPADTLPILPPHPRRSSWLFSSVSIELCLKQSEFPTRQDTFLPWWQNNQHKTRYSCFNILLDGVQIPWQGAWNEIMSRVEWVWPAWLN